VIIEPGSLWVHRNGIALALVISAQAAVISVPPVMDQATQLRRSIVVEISFMTWAIENGYWSRLL